MSLFFQTIPKPLRQHPIYKKIIRSAISKDLGEKLPTPQSFNLVFFSILKMFINRSMKKSALILAIRIYSKKWLESLLLGLSHRYHHKIVKAAPTLSES